VDLLDGSLLLPFYAFGGVVVVKLLRWRAQKTKAHIALVEPAAGETPHSASNRLPGHL